jgi:hypothetical protein
MKEAVGWICYKEHGQIQGGGQTFIYQHFIVTDLLNEKHHPPSFTEKPQVLIHLMQCIIQTHKPTWTDCRQLLLTLFHTEEQSCIMATPNWLVDHASVSILNAQGYAQA